MAEFAIDPVRIRRAWEGRISGCQLGKPVELLSMSRGWAELTDYLERADALPLRDYVPLIEGTLVETPFFFGNSARPSLYFVNSIFLVSTKSGPICNL